MSRPSFSFLLAGAFLALGPSAGAQAKKPAPEPETRAGVVITVEGIGGLDLLASNTTHACRKAGLKHEVRRFTWTHGVGKFFRDLQDTQHLVRKANELAEQIRELRKQDPERPIYLLAHSGGTAIVLFALENLPPGSVDRAILLAAAVSPNYDLRPALRATRTEIVSFNSAHDQLILNWGTRQFGTADRYYGPSAGLHGFTVPPQLDEEGQALYRRLVQVPWRGKMFWEGHNGGHLGSGFPTFLNAEVTPWLRSRESLP